MVAFTASVIVALVVAGGIVAYSRRRPAGAPLTWGEAMVGALVVFFLMFWSYGVVPHYWLTWADNELGWRADKLVFGPGDILKPEASGGWLPVTITYLVIRDIIAVAIYGAILGANIGLWALWQNRGRKPAEPVETSTFGRPLVREGAPA
ncbi:MAG: hypothetical protein D6683_08640 [Actinomyces sp.]|nr:MAG: hypothetical protein D6683_08640 [Actinomyces sp.]